MSEKEQPKALHLWIGGLVLLGFVIFIAWAFARMGARP
jgi:hypothetical protein